jgi:predicted nucleic acid-binding protein
MAQLIDTSILITLERRGWWLNNLAATAPDEPIALARITASELLMGVYRANTPDRQARQRVFVEALLGRSPVLRGDPQVARPYRSAPAEHTNAVSPILWDV